MQRHAKAFVALLLTLSLTCTTALGQAGGGARPQTAGDLLRDIKEAANFERGDQRQRLVEAIEQAEGDTAGQMLQEVIAEVQNRHQTDDANFVGHCIIALGEAGTRAATDTLLDALQDQNLQTAYQAAVALGRIWEGDRLTSPEAVQVNVALLARFYSPLPDLFIYGPGVAICRINNIMDVERVGQRTPQQLRSDVDAWLVNNTAGLPSTNNWPWQLLLRRAIVTDDAAERQTAVQSLLEKRALGPVGPILDVLAREEAPEQLRSSLADLLGQVTGVPYPPAGQSENSAQQAVARWRQMWFERLKTQTDEKYIDYAWTELENALRRYEQQPSDEAAQRVTNLRSVVVYQLPGPGAIPQQASPEARELMTEPLRSKRTIATALEVLEDGESTDFAKANALEDIEREVARDHGPVVGEQFLQPLARVAATETNTMFTSRLGNILWAVSGVPLQLDAPSAETRANRLREWARTLEAREGISLQLPI